MTDSSGALEILAELQMQTEILSSVSANLEYVRNSLCDLAEFSALLLSSVAVVGGLFFGYLFIRDLLNRFLGG